MGLLDKAVRLASTAKGQYDDLRVARDAAAVAPVAPEPLDAHREQVLRRAIACGAPEPDALLSRAEAAHLLGVELGEGRLIYDDSSIGLEFAAAGRRHDRWSVAVSAWHAGEELAEPCDPAEQYRFIAEHVEGEPVAGLGQEAVWDGSVLYVLAAPLLFHVQVRTPAGGGHRDAAEAAARRVLARMAV